MICLLLSIRIWIKADRVLRRRLQELNMAPYEAVRCNAVFFVLVMTCIYSSFVAFHTAYYIS